MIDASSQAIPSPKPPRPCPICGKPRVDAYSPFCSKRCADVDLHRWLGGVYALPSEPLTGDGSSEHDDKD